MRRLLKSSRFNLRSIDLAIVFFFEAQQGFSESTADLILINGKIITVDAKDSIAQAIAIREGKILAVGDNEEIRKQAGKDTLRKFYRKHHRLQL